MEIRKAAFAGSWYPGSTSACRQEIEACLAEKIGRDLETKSWVGGIVPHAGWYYSGSLAAGVIHLLKDTSPPDVVVLFGMHLHSQSSNYLMNRGAWETPVGNLSVAVNLAEELQRQFDFKLETPRHFTPDNTVEVQLPFVKQLIDPAQVLAIGVPPAPLSLEIGRAVAQWAVEQGKRIKIIGSTDLTHYGSNYDFSPQGTGRQAVEWVRSYNDQRVIDAMLAMNPERVLQEGLRNKNACCAGAVAAAISAVCHLGATHSQLVGYASSYDKSPGESFVGYVGIVYG